MWEKRYKYKYTFLLRLMKLLLFCLIIVILVFVFFITCRLKTVVVEGSSQYTNEEIENKIFTKPTDKSTILLYLRYKYGEPVSIPFIEDIDLVLVDKNTVKIHVYEKIIVGSIEYMGKYMYFDKDGIIVESSNIRLDKVPLCLGLSFDQIILYEKLHIQKETLFDIVLNLTHLIQKYDLSIDTIEFNTDLEVVLHGEDVKILLGKRENYDEQVAELKNLLPKAIGKNLTLDMKNFKEGQAKVIAKPNN